MARKKSCARCRARSKCKSLCDEIRAQLPTTRAHPGVALYGAWPLEDDLMTGCERKPSEMASYADKRLLKLASSIRSKFTSKEWRTLILIWGRGCRHDEAAAIQRITEHAVDCRMARVRRILRKHFAKNNS